MTSRGPTSGEESASTAHVYIAHHGTLAEQAAVLSAAKAAENSGQRQWIHYHPHGHLCRSRCGPLGGIR